MAIVRVSTLKYPPTWSVTLEKCKHEYITLGSKVNKVILVLVAKLTRNWHFFSGSEINFRLINKKSEGKHDLKYQIVLMDKLAKTRETETDGQ